MRTFSLLFSVILLVPFVVASGVYVSDPDGTDQPNCGTSADTPCKSLIYTVQSRAVDGDTVLVMGGLYSGPENVPLVVNKSISIVGAVDDPSAAMIYCASVDSLKSPCITVYIRGGMKISSLTFYGFVAQIPNEDGATLMSITQFGHGMRDNLTNSLDLVNNVFTNNQFSGKVSSVEQWKNGVVVGVFFLGPTTTVRIQQNEFSTNQITCIGSLYANVIVQGNVFLKNSPTAMATLFAAAIHPWWGGDRVAFDGNEVLENTGVSVDKGLNLPLVSFYGMRCSTENKNCSAFQAIGNTFKRNIETSNLIGLSEAYARIYDNEVVVDSSKAAVACEPNPITQCRIDMVNNTWTGGVVTKFTAVQGAFFGNITALNVNRFDGRAVWITAPSDLRISNCSFESTNASAYAVVVGSNPSGTPSGSLVVVQNSTFINSRLWFMSFPIIDQNGSTIQGGGLISAIVFNSHFSQTNSTQGLLWASGQVFLTVSGSQFTNHQSSRLLQCDLPQVYPGKIATLAAPTLVQFAGYANQLYGEDDIDIKVDKSECIVTCDPNNRKFCSKTSGPAKIYSTGGVSKSQYNTVVALLSVWGSIGTIAFFALVAFFVMTRRNYDIQ